MISYLAILLMGFTLGLLGRGGSILTVPILVYIFKLNAVTATAYSLFIVGSAASVGAYRNFKSKNLDIKTGLTFAIPGIVGVFCSRAFIIPSLPETIVSINSFILKKDDFILFVFALMMILASYSMIFGRTENQNKVKKGQSHLSFLGFIVGLFTGFVGAGGGFIIIPVLNRLAGLDIKKAIGTSLFIISLNSVIGFTGDLINLDVEWSLLIALSIIAVFGILFGTSVSSKVPAKILKKGFGVFVLVLGSWIIIRSL